LWLVKWGDRILLDGVVLIRNLSEGLGRLGYCSGLLEWCRPFLAPLYAWSAAAPDGAVLPIPAIVRTVLEFIVGELRSGKHMTSGKAHSQDLGEIFRTDAKGEQDMVTIGGWECRGKRPVGQCRWFSVEVNSAMAPWLYERGHTSRTIASSELLGTLLAVQLFIEPGDRVTLPGPSHGLLKCSGATDNQGNSYVVNKFMTTALPLSAVLMQLAVLLAARNLWLNLEWLPRTANTEADMLTNNDFSLFDPSLRVPVSWGQLDFTVMNRVLESSRAFTAEVEAQRSIKAAQPVPYVKKRGKKRKTVWG
jgi:hypothetical protein